ncbi:unnamed protein product [Camellia sinensis]
MFKTLLSADIKHARSSEDLVARATRHRKLSLEPRSSRSSEEKPRPLEPRKARSSQERQLSGPEPDATLARAKPLWLDPPDTTQLSLERQTPGSSEGQKIWAATLGSQTQPT